MSVHMNLGSHNPDLSRNHKVIDELTALVEASERAAFTTKFPAESSPESEGGLLASALTQSPASPELPRFDPAYDAGVETFPGQFEGEEQ